MMACIKAIFVFSLLAVPIARAEDHDLAGNPIRKVVTMLQAMSRKITAEGEKEQKMFDKFMCYCKTSKAALDASIKEAEVTIGTLPTEIEQGEAKHASLQEAISTYKADLKDAKTAIVDATAIREKEAKIFAEESEQYKTDISAVERAIPALRKGLKGAFLQTFLQSKSVQTLLKALDAQTKMIEADRQELVSFLSGEASGGEDAPSTVEIIPLLEKMGDSFKDDLESITTEEAGKIKIFSELLAAKKKEIAGYSVEIETKTVMVGELGVKIAQMKGDLGDSEAALEADKKFLENLEEDCAAKTKEWGDIKMNRANELVAVAETIKILNDDDALEIFKKTLPGASAAFLQVLDRRAKALAVIEKSIASSQKLDRPKLDFVALALRGKKIGFEKVIKMIDNMMVTLKSEQKADEQEKAYCLKEFDIQADKVKALKSSVADAETKIADLKASVETLEGEIKDLKKGITALDKSTAEAMEQRKEEYEDYTELVASDSAAIELLKFAMNRLNQFYNPKLSPAFVQVSKEAHHAVRSDVEPGPPPAAPSAYKTKSQEGTGVMAMLNKLIKGLETEITEAKVEEETAQAEYESLMKSSEAKRAADAASITEKESAKAEMDSDLQEAEQGKKSDEKEIMATEEWISSLHAQCDFIIESFDMRKEARAGEIEALKSAKAVLSGADLSLVQTHKKFSA